MRSISGITQLFALLLPWSIRRRVLNTCLGFSIEPTARIGFSILMVDRLTIERGAAIGSLTVAKGLSHLRLGERAFLGNLNWITAVDKNSAHHFTHELTRDPSLTIGAHAAITHRHLIDCTGGVRIGSFATLAGWGSQILTHSIDLERSRQSSAQVSIGEYAFVGTRCVLLKGGEVPPRSVLAAGAVVTDRLEDPDSVYGGVPAKRIASTKADSAYFIRGDGFVY